MRYPARVTAVAEDALCLELDLSGLAPGRFPVLHAMLDFFWTFRPELVRASRCGDCFEVVLIRDDERYGLFASLPADPRWLAWDNRTVRQLAQRIRETDDDASLFAILADALEEAGCKEETILARCRDSENDDLRWLTTLLATQA
jgi:hypothetical protein